MGSKLAGAAINGLDAMAQVFFPYASSAARNREPGALAEIAVDGTRVTLLAGLMASLVFVVLASPGIRAWVGPGYGTSAQVLMVLAAATALASPVRALGNILIGSGKLPTVCAIRSVEVTVNLVLSITLALVHGPGGRGHGDAGRDPSRPSAGIPRGRVPGHGAPVSTVVRRAFVPNIVPAVGCTVVLLGLRLVPLGSVPWLFFEAAAGCAAYLGLFFATAATHG